MAGNDKTMAGKIRRGAIRIGLEVIQGLGSSGEQPPEEKAPDNVKEARNFPYINREGIPLAMDIFQPVGPEYDERELPVIVTIHGGGLVTGDRKISLNLSRDLASRGYLVFAIEYRLAPRANVCEQLDDVCAGLDLVGSKLVEYDVDYSRIFLTADSAGAFLAIYTAAMKNSVKLQRVIGHEPSRMVFKALGISCGMFYTNKDDILGALLSEQFYGDRKDDSNFIQYMNPEHPEIVNNLPPTFFVTSRGDFLNQYTISYSKALKRAGKTSKLLYYSEEYLNHTFNFAHPDFPQSKDANTKMLAFFEEQAAIYADRQINSVQKEKEYKELKKSIETGKSGNMKMYKAIKTLNSFDETRLDAPALKCDGKTVSYRQMFRKWDEYAEVFSAINMTGGKKARVIIPGAMTKEAIYSFYALNMTGAVISLYPYRIMGNIDDMLSAIEREKITDVILTDYETSPAYARKLARSKEELGLNNIIILDTQLPESEMSKEELMLTRSNISQLKKVQGVSFMSDLLVKYEASKIVIDDNTSDETLIFHELQAEENKFASLGLAEEALNRIVYELSSLYSKDTSTALAGLSCDLFSRSVLVNQLQLTLFIGNQLVITHKTIYNKDFFKKACGNYVNYLFLREIDMKRIMASAKGLRMNASSIDVLYLFAEKMTKEKTDAIQDFFEMYGGHPQIVVLGNSGSMLVGKRTKPRTVFTLAPLRPIPAAKPMTMPLTPYAPAGLPALSASQRKLPSVGSMPNPLVWKDINGNKHDLSKIVEKIGIIATKMMNKPKKKALNPNEPNGNTDEGLKQLMGILAVMFEPSQTDYYYEE
ncbi:alpha/beta hydrolase [Butyrivibrio proteoclasticus]|uniref:alpha/beta hydrolase n=1 Tax=Butyrivibrio proteoclasticus TaxID=43305 RepID=UPI0004790E2E|nr:alpha/beta hydrolase [Butyrivibrio proteoclasticus]